MTIDSGHGSTVELLVLLAPFVLIALTLIGLWLVLRRREPIRPRWEIATGIAVVTVVAWLALAPDEMSVTERLLTILPAAAFVVVVLPTAEVLRRTARGQDD